VSGRAPLVILPRELGAVPPAPELVGVKARGMAQLLALKARVPRFGILTAEAFDAHMAQAEIAEVIAAATRSGLPDEAARLGHGDAIVRAVMRQPRP
jgi:phosphoenolpyruvate synthase/pyruvate phosphate dikinase